DSCSDGSLGADFGSPQYGLHIGLVDNGLGTSIGLGFVSEMCSVRTASSGKEVVLDFEKKTSEMAKSGMLGSQVYLMKVVLNSRFSSTVLCAHSLCLQLVFRLNSIDPIPFSFKQVEFVPILFDKRETIPNVSISELSKGGYQMAPLCKKKIRTGTQHFTEK
ncbi:hypothetical protein Tco_0947409, partial [Tanacetum coccineum]